MLPIQTHTPLLPGPDVTPDVGKRAFMRMVSHELRTPLNSIIGFAEVLNQELYGPLGSPQYVEYAGIIRDSGKKLLGLFNDVLEIIRLDSDPGLTLVSDTLLPHLEDAVRRHQARAAQRALKLHLAYDDAELCATFDARALGNSLDHLLNNAIDFTPDGQRIEVTVKTRLPHVDIGVFNPGPAPHPDELPRLMRPFEQGSSDHARQRDGAGLGWAIVRLSCQAMGGAFRVQSDPEIGLKAVMRLRSGI